MGGSSGGGVASTSCDDDGVSTAEARELLERWVVHGASDPKVLRDLSAKDYGLLWAAGWEEPVSVPADGGGAIGREDVDEAAYRRKCTAAEELRERSLYDWNDGFRKEHRNLCADFDVIDRDVPRTQLPSGGRFREWSATELTQVLEAHLVAESELPEGVGMGYVQGMADVAAFMLQRMPPSRAYRCVRRLCARPIVRTFFRLDVDEWLLLSTVFSNLIGVHCPQAFSRLTDLGLEPAIYLPEWLMPLWTRSLSEEVASHLFSLTLLEGDAIFVRAALAVCVTIEPLLIAAKELSDCRRLLSDAPQHIELADFIAALSACPVDEMTIAPLLRCGGFAPPPLHG